jgi:hypothetical protein
MVRTCVAYSKAQPVPVAERSKAWVCGRLPAEIMSSNPTEDMDVCFECCVLSGRGLCDELITRPEESYRLWCVVVCDLETSLNRRPWPKGGCGAPKKIQSFAGTNKVPGLFWGYFLFFSSVLFFFFCRAQWLMPPDVPQSVRLIVLTLL